MILWQRPTPRSALGSAPLFFLFALTLLVSSAVYAQENNTINVAGSGIAAPAFEAVVEGSGVESVNININGTNTGIAELCAGTVDIALANRPLAIEEESMCVTTGVEFIEVPLGYSATAFVASAENTFLTCLGGTELNALLAPSATGQTADWTVINGSYPANPVNVVLPPQTSMAYGQVDQIVLGEGLRSDATFVEDDAAVLSAVAADPNALGVVRVASVGDNTAVKLLGYNNPTLNTCITPSADSLADRSYGLSDRLFAYVNAASLQKAGMNDLLTFATSAEGAQAINDAGFAPLTDDALITAQEIVASGTVGREFSGDVTAFTIQPDVTGALLLGGATDIKSYADSLTQSLAVTASGLVLTPEFEGVPAGVRRFCNGELQVLFTYGDLDAESAANCAANNINPVSYTLAHRATVLVANGDNENLACLTRDQIISALGTADAESLPTTWNQVDESFTETEIVWVVPTTSGVMVDMLLTSADGVAIPRREQVAETNANPLYRAAAVANVEGGITFMSWQDYEDVLEANQQGVQLVAVNDGSTCVTPGQATITDGTYPLAREIRITVTESSLADPTVQTLLWFIFSDSNYALFDNSSLIGVPFGQLAEIRSTLQEAFDAAITAVELFGTEEPGGTEEPAPTEETVTEEAATEEAATEEAATEEAATEEAATEAAGDELTPEVTPES